MESDSNNLLGNQKNLRVHPAAKYPDPFLNSTEFLKSMFQQHTAEPVFHYATDQQRFC